LTTILNRPVRVFALVSVAEQLTVVCPTLKRLPDLGRQVAATDPSIASRAVTL
jgi:hypothetical protein